MIRIHTIQCPLWARPSSKSSYDIASSNFLDDSVREMLLFLQIKILIMLAINSSFGCSQNMDLDTCDTETAPWVGQFEKLVSKGSGCSPCVH